MPRGIPNSSKTKKQETPMSEQAVTNKPVDASKVQFFSSVDIDARTGKVSSEFPAWFFTQQMENMDDEIRSIEYRLENGDVPAASIPYYKNQLRRLKDRRDKIEASKPKMSAMERDFVAKSVDTLGEKISESMFTREEEQRGFADAHEEARRMSTPCIKVDPGFADAFGIKTVKGLVSRNDAVKMWKIGRRSLGDDVNVEILRRK